MGISDGSRYAYIVARIRAMKSKLIPNDMYPKFLNMEIPEITRFIGESEYKKDVDELSNKYSGTDLFEHALNENLALTYRKLMDVSQGEANFLITEYLRSWDIWNIKTIIRGKFSGAGDDEILEDVVSAGQLRYRDITEIVKIDTVEGVIAAFAGTPYYSILKEYSGDLAELENKLDKMYYSNLLKAVSSTGNKLFLRYLRKEIDLKNLKLLFRMKHAGMQRDDMLKILIPGGFEIGDADLNKLSSLSFDEFVRALEEYSYWNAISDVCDEFNSLWNVESRLDKYAQSYITRISYYYPLSILPVLAYVISKKIEIDNLRIIVRGKEMALRDEIIKNHLVM